MTPNTTRVPLVVNKAPEIERREAQVQDPFPDTKFGPETGFRPLGYQSQRAEPLRAKDRYLTALFKIRRPNFSFSPGAWIPPQMAFAPQQLSLAPPPIGMPVTPAPIAGGGPFAPMTVTPGQMGPPQAFVPSAPMVYYPPVVY